MKKLILVLGVFGAVAVGACGESDECEHLAETCAKCSDAGVKAACEAIADSDDHGQCETSHESYDMMCE